MSPRGMLRSVCVLLLVIGSAGACTIPVFRFALDRWQADSFQLMAPESWWAGPEGRSLSNRLKGGINLAASPVTPEDGRFQLLRPEDGSVLWRGALDDQALGRLTGSPARSEIARRIVDGQSAVWVMVTGENEEDTRVFHEHLKERLAYLEQVATIPPQDPLDPDSQLGPGPDLRVDFSVLSVRREDPAEEPFLSMLAGASGAELLQSGKPFAAPVFGRGRVLGAWPAADLDDEGIDELCLFLLGACSCRVKNLNPGWELLMDCDWDEQLMAVELAGETDSDAERPGPGPQSAPVSPAPEVVSFGGGDGDGVISSPASTPLSAPVAATIVLITLGAVILGWKTAG